MSSPAAPRSLSVREFCYRLPFYINMIANGYFYYWSIRAEFWRWPIGGGALGLAYWVAMW